MYTIRGLNVLFTSTANLYLICLGGDVVSRNFIMYADCLFETDWYKMANPLQKYFIIMIAETQKPLYFDGYSIININLEAFSKVFLR